MVHLRQSGNYIRVDQTVEYCHSHQVYLVEYKLELSGRRKRIWEFHKIFGSLWGFEIFGKFWK